METVTINEVEHKIADLPEEVVANISRVVELRGEHKALVMRATEAQVLINIYTNEIAEAMKPEED